MRGENKYQMKKIIKQQLRGLGFGEKVNTFIIGAQKCGTTTLHTSLVQHPEIYGPGSTMKETHFWHGGPPFKSKAEYENRYPLLPPPRTRLLDSTPDYISTNGTIKKIFDYNPKAKFILLLRDPVKRALSAWIHYHYAFPKDSSWRGINVHDHRTFQEAIADELQFNNGDLTKNYLSMGYYAEQIERELFFIPEENLKIAIVEEDFYPRPQLFIDEILQSLNVEPFPLNIVKRNVSNQPQIKIEDISPELTTLLKNHFRKKNRSLEILLNREIRTWK
jgi:hypothetical protein